MSQASNIQSQIDNITNVTLPAAKEKLAAANGVIQQAPGIIALAHREIEEAGCEIRYGATNARLRNKHRDKIEACKTSARNRQSLWKGKLGTAKTDKAAAEKDIEVLEGLLSTLKNEYQTALQNERDISTKKADASA